jgi:CheY-like chemotaxis protein
MEFNQLPCIYTPTQVMMVDDNLSFLENIRLAFDDYQNVILFSNPMAAITMLREYQSEFNALDLLKHVNCDELDEDSALSIDYKKLHEFINKTSEISVLIVDYSMPEMNGIEFLNQIKSNPAKKIMLTGEADNHIAVNAFNEGLIDKFIIKGGSEVNKMLNQSVSQLKKQYFLDTKLNQLIAINSLIKGSADYVRLVNEWLKKYAISRFYQINQQGSLIGLDKDNIYRCFYLLGSKDLDEYLDVAESHGADQLLITQLSNKQNMPVFITDEHRTTPVSQWEGFLKPIIDYFDFNLEQYYYCEMIPVS